MAHLNRKSIVAATMPVPLKETEVVPARIAIQAHCPMAANNMSLRYVEGEQSALCGRKKTYSADPVNGLDGY